MIRSWMRTLNRVLLRSKNELEAYARANPKVCMIVWNTFETDARVTKEAVSLTKAGKAVTVIAVHAPGKTKRSESQHGFHVIRVDRTLRKRDSSAVQVTNRTTSHSDHHSSTKTINHVKQRPLMKKAVTFMIKYMKRLKNRLRNRLKKIPKLVLSKLRKRLPFLPKLIINIRFFTHAYRNKAGIYHSHDLNTLIPAYLVSRLRGTKLIYDAHEVSTDRAGWKNKKWWETIERILIRKADQVITTNQTRAEYFAKQYAISPPHIIRNVPPYQELKKTNRIREVCQIDEEQPIILYQGGIQRERGIENMVKCIPLVRKGVFVFIGNGALKPDIINLVEDLGLQSRACFIDAVPNEELLTYTASADIGLQLLQNTCFNHYSACSNKLHEYLMAGIPVIASDLPEMRKVVETTKTGLLVNPDEIEMVAQAINQLIEDKDLYHRLQQNTRKAATMYKWENEEQKLLSIYGIKMA